VPYKESPLPIAKQIVNHRNTAYLAPLRKWFTHSRRGAPQPHVVVPAPFGKGSIPCKYCNATLIVINTIFIKIVDHNLFWVFSLTFQFHSCKFMLIFNLSLLDRRHNKNNRWLYYRCLFYRAVTKKRKRSVHMVWNFN